MADQKISTLTSGTPLSTDYIPYVDAVAGSTKKVAVSSLLGVAGTNMFNEVPTGVTNNSNIAFTLSHTPLAGTLRIYLNGIRQMLTSDYSVVTATITFVSAPDNSSNLFVDYIY